eukprot:932682-Rhodomonas_salina.1
MSSSCCCHVARIRGHVTITCAPLPTTHAYNARRVPAHSYCAAVHGVLARGGRGKMGVAYNARVVWATMHE